MDPDVPSPPDSITYSDDSPPQRKGFHRSQSVGVLYSLCPQPTGDTVTRNSPSGYIDTESVSSSSGSIGLPTSSGRRRSMFARSEEISIHTDSLGETGPPSLGDQRNQGGLVRRMSETSLWKWLTTTYDPPAATSTHVSGGTQAAVSDTKPVALQLDSCQSQPFGTPPTEQQRGSVKPLLRSISARDLNAMSPTNW